MKSLLLAIIAVFSLTACDGNNRSTYVSKGLFDKNTIVSTPSSSGYTRTEYGRDWFGNKKISVTGGHENPTEQHDLLVGGLLLGGIIIEALLEN